MEEVNLKDDTLLNFAINQEKHVDKVLKKLFDSNSMADKTRNTAQKMKFSMKDFFRKCDQTLSKLQIWSHLLKKSLLENVIFCAVEILKTCRYQTRCCHVRFM